MRGIVVGFVAGALVTSALFLVLGSDGNSFPEPGAELAEPAVRTPVSSVEAVAELPSDTRDAQANAGSESVSEPAVQAAVSARTLMLMDGSRPGVLRETGEKARILHADEPVDPSWAQTAENEFANFTGRNGELLTRYGAPEVECRSNWCEARITSYDGEEINPEDWYRLFRDGVGDYPWQHHWASTGFTLSEEDGATEVSWYFRRIGSPGNPALQFVTITGFPIFEQ